MILRNRSKRRRSVRPVLVSLEERTLLNAALPNHMKDVRVPAQVVDAKLQKNNQHQASGPMITILGTASAGGFQFTNFDGPTPGTNAGTGTNMNGISNTGIAVGFTIANNGNLNNFATDPLTSTSAVSLNINDSTTAMALGINARRMVVGTDGQGNAVVGSSSSGVKTFIPPGGASAVAFGINDVGMIVGQDVTATGTPGFIRVLPGSYITINAPSGPNVVNAQGIDNNGRVVGFYVGNDGQDHGFLANSRTATNGTLTGIPIPDPTIPAVPGEPGATFVFSQVLGINDHGIAVGYYGDSTTSQHGFIYNTVTGKYTFLDDPAEAFDNGVEVTQITGINNSGEITGFYSDANGVFHGFVATTPRVLYR
jgi:hypothetical protein